MLKRGRKEKKTPRRVLHASGSRLTGKNSKKQVIVERVGVSVGLHGTPPNPCSLSFEFDMINCCAQ